MEKILFFIPFGIYLIYILFQLFKVLKNKEADNSEKFAKGTSKYSGRIMFLTIIATMIGPGYSYGAIDEFYKHGFFYTLFFLLAILQFWLFGHFFAGKIKNIGENKQTVGDILGEAYGKPAQIIAGVLTIMFSIAIVGVIGLGGGKVLSSISEIPLNMSVVIIVSFITIYSFYGGIAAVIKTDKVQFILICIFGLIGVIAGGNQLITNSNQTIDWSLFLWNTNNMPISVIIGTSIAFFLGEAFLPVYSIRGLIARNPEVARKSFKYTAYFGFLWFVALTFIAISAHTINHSNELTYLRLIKETFGGFVGALVIGIAVTGMLSVVMSTLDSILNAGGVSFRRDIAEQSLIIDSAQKLSYSRLAILLIAVLGVFVTVFIQDIVGLLIWGYTLWVPTITFPLGYYLIKGKVKNKNSGLFGIIFGIIGWMLFEFFIKSQIPSIFVGLILNVVIFLIIEQSSKDGRIKDKRLGEIKEFS